MLSDEQKELITSWLFEQKIYLWENKMENIKDKIEVIKSVTDNEQKSVASILSIFELMNKWNLDREIVQVKLERRDIKMNLQMD